MVNSLESELLKNVIWLAVLVPTGLPHRALPVAI